MTLSRNGQLNEDGSFDWEDALIDASISAGTAAAASMATAIMDGGFTSNEFYIAGIIGLSAFFGYLSLKRKLTPEKSP